MDIPFTTFINDMGIWYSITVEFEDFKIVFRDSLKVLNFSLDKIAEVLEFPFRKGDTPLLTNKPKKIKKTWIDYLKRDLQILAFGIYGLYIDENFTKFTSASEAISEFKKTVKYRKLFPLLDSETDDFLRPAYRGGFAYVNEKFKNKLINKPIVVYDENSMYPDKLLNYPLPFGEPTFYEGEPDFDGSYFVAKIWINFELKKDHIPTIQTKSLKTALELGIKRTDYIKSSKNELIPFTLTNFDLEMIFKHYDVNEIIYDSYYKFETKLGMFTEYIDKYRIIKETTLSPVTRTKAKLMSNSLYGKFGSKILSRQKIPVFNDGVLGFEYSEYEEVKPNYIPIAIFVTSLARKEIQTICQENFDNYIYSDTDSIHMIDTGIEPKIKIDNKKYGFWKLEGKFKRGKYLRAKMYIEEKQDGSLDVKGAGMNDKVKEQVTFENFEFGSVFNGKIMKKQVIGGVLLYDSTFEIKENGLLL